GIGGLGIFATNGINTGTVAVTTASGGPFITLDSSSLAINSAGLVSFTGSTSGINGVYAASVGSSTITIADSSGPLNVFTGLTSINDSGVIAFQSTFDGGLTVGVFKGSGGALTPLADSSGSLGTSPTVPSINASGLTAFASNTDSAGVTGVFTASGGPVTTVMDSTGPYSSFETIPTNGPSMNASGKVIFRATPDIGLSGFFDGPTPAANKVIAIGDLLDGSQVMFLSALGSRINDAGQFVFYAQLQDGRNTIFRADPIPESGAWWFAAVVALAGFHFRRQRRLRPDLPGILR
ncbi:MAG TPA: hypothetical protein VH518_08085, partial [Tepidisphaeraceae bacterium]